MRRRRATVGVVGEVDPARARGARHRRAGRRGSSSTSDALLAAPDGADELRPVSRYPSSDIDLAFEVRRRRPGGRGRSARSARPAASCSSTSRLFDVYRGAGVADGRAQPGLPPALQRPRPHAHRRRGRRASAPRCIDAVESAHRRPPAGLTPGRDCATARRDSRSCMSMRHAYSHAMARIGIVGASGYTGAELLRLCAGHPDLEVALGHRRHPGRHAGRRPLPEPGRRLPRPASSSRYDADRGRRPRPRVPRPAPRRSPARSCPTLRKRVRRVVDLGRRLPAAGPRRSTRSGTARSTPRPSCSTEFAYGLPELFRDEIGGRRRGRRRRAATRPRPRSPSPRSCAAGVDRADGHRRRRRQRRVGRRPGPEAHTHFGTANEDFTAYGLLDHRHTPEIEQATGAPGAVHAAPGADDPGHPRHLLRPARPARRRTDDAARPSCTTPTPTSRSCVVDRRAAVDQGDARAPTRAHVTARYDERTGWVVVLVRHRQPGEGRVGPGGPVRQPRSSASPRPTGLPTVGVYP